MVRALFHFTFILLSTPAFAVPLVTPTADWTYVHQKLKAAGFKPKFIELLKKHYRKDDFLQVLELNTLLFLKKSDYHGPQVDKSAAGAVRDFRAKNESAFAAAGAKYDVDPDVIASLLWIESRHGKMTGQFHVASVFITLLQADRPDVKKHLYKAGHRFTKKVTTQNKRDIAKRTKKRVKWAIEELQALEKMQKRDSLVIPNLKGSFAGAFGMPQFIPSSFVHYAKTPSKTAPHLEKPEDAIHSVANYLHKSGWKSAKKKSFVKALLRYNNSQDYAMAILNLAKLAGTSAVTEPKTLVADESLPEPKMPEEKEKAQAESHSATADVTTGEVQELDPVKPNASASEVNP